MSWTKLHSKLSSSEHFADLVAEHGPWTGLVWCLILANGGVWGRLPRSPRQLRLRIAGLLDSLTTEQLEQSIQGLLAADMLHEYTDSEGRALLEIVNWWAYNETNFARVGRPEYGPAPDWQPPDALLRYLALVVDGHYPNRSLDSELQRLRLDESETIRRLFTDYSETTHGVQEEQAAVQELPPEPILHDYSVTTPPRDVRLETQTRDTDTATEGEKPPSVVLDTRARARGSVERLNPAVIAEEKAQIDGHGQDDAMVLNNNGLLKDHIRGLCPDLTLRQVQWLTVNISRTLRTETFPWTECEFRAYLQEAPPTPATDFKQWLARAERVAHARTQEARASPAPPDTSEPELFKQARALQEEASDVDLAE